jgi:hypothetical protein
LRQWFKDEIQGWHAGCIAVAGELRERSNMHTTLGRAFVLALGIGTILGVTTVNAQSLRADVASAAVSRGAAQGQNGGVGFGVLGGFQRTTFRTDDDLEDLLDDGNGLMVGLWVGGNRNGRVGFVGEFIYLHRQADTAAGELKFPAVEIPAVFHINFGSRDREGLMGYALVGPVFTLNLKQELNGVELDDDEGFRGADIGLMAGGGFEVLRFAVEVRGNWGLRNINSEGDLADLKTRAIEVVAKFRLN